MLRYAFINKLDEPSKYSIEYIMKYNMEYFSDIKYLSRNEGINNEKKALLNSVLNYNENENKSLIFKQKDKVEQIIYMFSKILVSIISSTSQSEAINCFHMFSYYNNPDLLIYVDTLNVIHKKYDINNLLQICQFPKSIMIRFFLGKRFTAASALAILSAPTS